MIWSSTTSSNPYKTSSICIAISQNLFLTYPLFLPILFSPLSMWSLIYQKRTSKCKKYCMHGWYTSLFIYQKSFFSHFQQVIFFVSPRIFLTGVPTLYKNPLSSNALNNYPSLQDFINLQSYDTFTAISIVPKTTPKIK